MWTLSNIKEIVILPNGTIHIEFNTGDSQHACYIEQHELFSMLSSAMTKQAKMLEWYFTIKSLKEYIKKWVEEDQGTIDESKEYLIELEKEEYDYNVIEMYIQGQ